MASDADLIARASRRVTELQEHLTLRISNDLAVRLGFLGASMRVGAQGAAIDVWKRADEAAGTVFVSPNLQMLWREGPNVAVLRLSSALSKLPQEPGQAGRIPLVALQLGGTVHSVEAPVRRRPGRPKLE